MYYKALRDSVAEATEAALVNSDVDSGSGSTATPRVEDGVSMDNFYPALVQCFGIIICG